MRRAVFLGGDMKLKSPEGITDVSVAGVNYQPDSNGVFTVDDAHAGHLFQFGFVSAGQDGAMDDSEPDASPSPRSKKK